MPGWSNADNKFGLTPFIVGTVLGDGCNYSTVQSAIDDCFAAGGGVVGIRSGTYIENLTLRAGVDLYGFDVDGKLPSPLAKVLIQGNHTFAVAVGFGAVLGQYITFSSLAGDAFTLQAAAGAQAIIALKFSGVEAFTNPGQRAFVLDATAGGGAQFSTDNTNVNSSGHCFEGIGAGSQAAFISLGNCNSQSANVYEATAGSNSLTGEYTTLNGAIYIFSGPVDGNCSVRHSRMFSAQEACLFPAGTGSFDVFHSEVSSSAASGFFVDGAPGCSLNFVDISLNGSALNIGPSVTQNKYNWQPYAESAAGALGSNRGTASFYNNDFTVVDGFVSLVGSTSGAVTQLDADSGFAIPTTGIITIQGGAGVTTSAGGSTLTVSSVEWIDIAAPTLATVDTGYFDFGPTTITLPAAPAQGEQVRIFSVNAPTVVQADPAHTITIGNVTSVAGGTATGSASGDCLVLVYIASASRWGAESVIGNWTLA